MGAAIIEPFDGLIIPQAPGLAGLIHRAAGPEVLILRQNNAPGQAHMPEPRHMIGIQMREQHIIQLLLPYAHGSQLLMDRHAFWEIRMKKSCEMRRKDFADLLRIIDAPGAYLPAPACVHKDQALRVFDQIGENRECDPAFVGCSKLSCRFDQVEPFAIGNGRIDADASALQHVNLHEISF